ncbi:MAG: Flp1 family type IVb pilin [Paenibacillaceae bacterium]
MKQWKQQAKQWWSEEDGIGTLEVILIVAVIVIIAVAFRKWIISWVQKLFDTSNSELERTNQDTIIVPGPS